MRNLIYICTIILLGGLLVWGNGLLKYKFEMSSATGDVLDAIYGKSVLLERISVLERENAELRTDKLFADISPPGTFKVYSSYPENNLKELIIAAGKNKNIKVGEAVTYGKTIFVGEVINVADTWSVAKTIFDQNENVIVRIGDKEVDGLLKGGNTPTVTLINKKAEITVGDIILSADKKFHYGLEIGQIKEIIENPAEQFKSAIIEPIIQFSDIKNVSIQP